MEWFIKKVLFVLLLQGFEWQIAAGMYHTLFQMIFDYARAPRGNGLHRVVLRL